MDKLEELIEQVARLEKRINELEYKNSTNPFSPIGPNPILSKTQCYKCGMTFDGATGYVCTNIECRMGCGLTVC